MHHACIPTSIACVLTTDHAIRGCCTTVSRYRLATTPTLEYICQPGEYDYGSGAVILWMSFFTVSKIFELGDTFFVVVRKRPLILLHWYHHVTVLCVATQKHTFLMHTAFSGRLTGRVSAVPAQALHFPCFRL